MKIKIKNFLSKLPFVKSYFHGQAIILMLHRIAPLDNDRLTENEGLKVDPQGLEVFIKEALQERYRFISLDELYTCLQSNIFKDNKNIVMTLDDGYKDNLTYGLPIFKKYNIPFCTYLCTGFLDKPNMWWFSLEDFLLAHNTFVWNQIKYDISTHKKKSLLFLFLREYILRNISISKNAKEILESLGIPHDEYAYKNLALNQTDIQELLKYDIFTLGCHTDTHLVFNNFTFTEIENDIIVSLGKMEKLFHYKPSHFCFPFGGNDEISKKYCNFIKKFNFKTAVTTRSGTIYSAHKNFCHVLPRIYVKNSPKLQDLIQIRKQRIRTY